MQEERSKPPVDASRSGFEPRLWCSRASSDHTSVPTSPAAGQTNSTARAAHATCTAAAVSRSAARAVEGHSNHKMTAPGLEAAEGTPNPRLRLAGTPVDRCAPRRTTSSQSAGECLPQPVKPNDGAVDWMHGDAQRGATTSQNQCGATKSSAGVHTIVASGESHSVWGWALACTRVESVRSCVRECGPRMGRYLRARLSCDQHKRARTVPCGLGAIPLRCVESSQQVELLRYMAP